MKKCIVGSVLALFLVASPSRAEVKMSDKTKAATARALAWLKQRQNEDGSFSDGGFQHSTAITGFAMLAFMSQGHFPNQGLYGPEVAKASRFLMGAQQADGPSKGYIVGARNNFGHGNMYGHGIATLALSELWGQTNDDEIRKHVKDAVQLIINAQSEPEGGWRYAPVKSGADISVTIMQVMALRSARNAGLNVPDQTMEKALKYVESCYQEQQGGFTYMPHGGPAGFARTAAGTCVLFLSGKWEKIKKKAPGADPVPIKPGARKERDYSRAVDFLKNHFNEPTHFYYGHYYAAHSMHSVGGKDWDDWYARLEGYFLPQQSPDGSWSATRNSEVGPVYQTAIATIILSTPAHYLPIFQN